jgi:hypothetical protein
MLSQGVETLNLSRITRHGTGDSFCATPSKSTWCGASLIFSPPSLPLFLTQLLIGVLELDCGRFVFHVRQTTDRFTMLTSPFRPTLTPWLQRMLRCPYQEFSIGLEESRRGSEAASPFCRDCCAVSINAYKFTVPSREEVKSHRPHSHCILHYTVLKATS